MNFNAGDEHISYAMNNLADRANFFNYNPPSELLSPSFLVVECTIYACFFMAVTHAYITAKRTGSPSAILALLCMVMYGVVMELSSYYGMVAGWNGEFSIMLFWNRMPLLQPMHYTFFYYTLYMIVKRLDVSRFVGALSYGFMGAATMAAWDYFAPAVGMYTWSVDAGWNKSMIINAPSSSLQWLMTYSFVLFFVCDRFVSENSDNGRVRKAKMWVVLTPILVNLLGPFLMLPYNVLTMAVDNLPDIYPTIYHFSVVLVFGSVLVVNIKKIKSQEKDWLLMATILVWWGGAYIAYCLAPQAFESSWLPTKNAAGFPAGNIWLIVMFSVMSIGCTALMVLNTCKARLGGRAVL